jgi:hypothetical protein
VKAVAVVSDLIAQKHEMDFFVENATLWLLL